MNATLHNKIVPLMRTAFLWLRGIAVFMWLVALLKAVFGVPAALIWPTLVAVPIVWLCRRGDARSGFWASVMLAASGLVLTFSFSVYSFLGIALMAGAAYAILYGIGWAKIRAALSHPPARTQHVPPSGARGPIQTNAPQAAPAARDYDNNIRTPRYTFVDIIGMDETKKRLRTAAQAILAGKDRARNGVLLFGDPGNGKTLFAESLAGELKVPFLSIDYGDVASKWINETPQKIKAVFDAACGLEAGVLFIDEIDSFLKPRSGGNDGGAAHSMDKDMVNAMLTGIVNLRRTKMILIAATNFRDQLDSAGIREGRFDYQIEIPAPDLAARKALLLRGTERALGLVAVDRDAIDSLAARWEGFSAARLTALGDELADMRAEGLIPETERLSVEVGQQAMRRLQGRQGKLPEGVKAIDDMIMPEASREVLKDLAYRLSHSAALEKMNAKLPSGVLFSGPPGTGKTQAAMALAKESGFAFLKITGAKILARPSAWSAIVREAKDIRPCILFLDEADGILRDRQYTSYGMLTDEILTEMDGAGGRVRDLLYIAATNYPERLDTAAVRGGRFEVKVAFDVPSAPDMHHYVLRALEKHEEAGYEIPLEVADTFAERLTGLSIADADSAIQALIDAAAVRRHRDGARTLTLEDVDGAIVTVRGEVATT